MTGTPAATLRAWERRYGVPSPERTESSYRLYSESDVELIRRVRELCDAGMAPAEAARIVTRVAQAERGGPLDASSEDNEPSYDPYTGAQEMLLDAIDAFDPTALELAVRRMMFLGSAPIVFEQVLAPVMREVGDRWHSGQISVGQEHMASEILGGAARDMLRLFQAEENAPMALLACFADEEHALPLYGVAFRFAQWGFRTCLLGARTPPAAIQHAVQALDPEVVGLSLTVAPAGYRARELIDQYADACQDRAWLVGGAAAAVHRSLLERHGALVVDPESFAEASDLRARVEGMIAKHRRHERKRSVSHREPATSHRREPAPDRGSELHSSADAARRTEVSDGPLSTTNAPGAGSASRSASQRDRGAEPAE